MFLPKQTFGFCCLLWSNLYLVIYVDIRLYENKVFPLSDCLYQRDSTFSCLPISYMCLYAVIVFIHTDCYFKTFLSVFIGRARLGGAAGAQRTTRRWNQRRQGRVQRGCKLDARLKWLHTGMRIKPQSCCREGQELAEARLNAFSVVLYRRSQSTGDESRLKLGWCRRRAASQIWPDECGNACCVLAHNYRKVFSPPFRMFAGFCSHLAVFDRTWSGDFELV